MTTGGKKKRNNPTGNKEQILTCTPAAIKDTGGHHLRASKKCNPFGMVALPSIPFIKSVFCFRLPANFTDKTWNRECWMWNCWLGEFSSNSGREHTAAVPP